MHKGSAALSWRTAKERFGLVANGVNGKIESLTKVWSAPKTFDAQVPYFLALIILENQSKVTAQVVDSSPKIGDNVEPCIRRQHTDGNSGIIEYGTKFRVIK